MTNLNEVLQHEAQQLNIAESKLAELLPSVISSASHTLLQQALQDYAQQARVHVERLKMATSLMEVNPTDGKNKTAKGLLKELGKLAEMQLDLQVKDAALIATLQKNIHYKIAAYGTAKHYAETLGLAEVARTLSQSLEEEKAADQRLNDIAIKEVNPLAFKA